MGRVQPVKVEKGESHQAHNVLSVVCWEFSGCFPSAPEQLNFIMIPRAAEHHHDL